MGNQPILSARHLAIGYSHGKRRTTVVHKNLSFDFLAGELICLLGPNGAGKSTLLRTLSAFQPPLEGQLLLEGRPLAEWTEREKSRKIGVVLTDKTQAGGLTVYELVALGRQPHTGFWGRLAEADHEHIRQAVRAVGIEHKAQAYVAELSDGERQKAMIAKALVQECPLILLDEPTAFLDVVSRIEVMMLLHTIAQEQRKTILLSTHDIEQALLLADRLCLLSPESGLQCGVTEDMVFNGSLDRLFKREHICFDRVHGVYSSTVVGGRKAVVQSPDPALGHWTANLLRKYGYDCQVAADSAADRLMVQVSAPDHMLVRLDGREQICTSFEELACFLSC